jgi:hypothetical protein
MSAARLLLSVENYFDATPTLSGGSWETGLPRANMLIREMRYPSRSTDAEEASTVFDIDLGASLPVGVFALPYHTASTAGTIRLRGSANADMSAPAYDSTALLAYPAQWASDVLPSWHPAAANRKVTAAQWTAGMRWGFTHVLTAHTSARYWRVNISDTSNPYGYVELERPWLGPFFETGAAYGAEFGWADDSERTVSGASAGAHFHQRRRVRRRFNFSVDQETEATALGVLQSLVARRGMTEQVFVAYDAGDTTHLHERSFVAVPHQLQLMRIPFVSSHDVPFQFVEELYGPAIPPALPE